MKVIFVDQNVSKGRIIQCIKDGQCISIGDLKTKTKVGTGCGGCMPLVRRKYLMEWCDILTPVLSAKATNIFNAEMKKAGHQLNNHLCPHFAMSRTDIFNIIRVKNLRTFMQIMQDSGVNKDSIGCEICKPAIGSILSSL